MSKLFKTQSLAPIIHGFSRILDFGHALGPYRAEYVDPEVYEFAPSQLNQDAKAIASDWVMVGHDMNCAFLSHPTDHGVVSHRSIRGTRRAVRKMLKERLADRLRALDGPERDDLRERIERFVQDITPVMANMAGDSPPSLVDNTRHSKVGD